MLISIKKLLSINFILAAALPVVIVGLITLAVLSNSTEQEITQKNELLANSLAREFEQLLNEPVNLLKHTQQVIDSSEVMSLTTTNQYLESIVVTYDFFDMIMKLDSQGAITNLAPFDNNFVGLDMSYQSYFKSATDSKNIEWTKTFISPQSGEPTITISLPLEKGMLIGHLNLSAMSRVIDKVKIGTYGYATVIDKDATVIAHHNQQFVAERLNVMHFPFVQQALVGNVSTSKYHFLNEDKIASMAIVPQTGWLVAIVQPINEAFAPIKRVKSIIVLGSVSAIIFAIIFALNSIRITLKSFLLLTNESKRIAAGDYHFEESTGRIIEINNLENAFKVMISAIKQRETALQKSHDNLEQLVAERTVEVQRYLNVMNKYVITSKVDSNGIITSISDAFLKASGYTKEELLGHNHSIIHHPEEDPKLYKEIWETIQGGKSWHGEIKNRNKEGDTLWVEATIEPDLNSDDQFRGYTVIRNDITDKKRIEKLSITDQLTGIYNRVKLDEVFDREYKRLNRHNRQMSIILLDIDFFKKINDKFGHQVGDDVLVSIAKVTKDSIRATDTAGRWGGEEFLIICPETDLSGVTMLANKLCRAIEHYTFVNEIKVTASFGVTTARLEDRQTEILQRADDALYRAKSNGRNNVQWC